MNKFSIGDIVYMSEGYSCHRDDENYAGSGYNYSNDPHKIVIITKERGGKSDKYTGSYIYFLEDNKYYGIYEFALYGKQVIRNKKLEELLHENI